MMTLPYQRGSDTSEEAARSVRPHRERMADTVLAAISLRAMTDEELVEMTGLSPSTVRPRRVELVEAGLVRDSGERRPTRSGRKAVVWERCHKVSQPSLFGGAS